MLRIAAPTLSAHSAKKYYTHAVKEGVGDYYLAEEKIPGVWFGKLAGRLGLPLEVTQPAFESLCDNRHPVTGEQLTAKQQSGRRIGWDVTFNPPKSVSLIHALLGDERLVGAVQRAAVSTLAEMETHARCRVRKAGSDEDRQTGELVAALFRHMTTRPTPSTSASGKKATEDPLPDPQLHIHAFVLNLTHDPVENRLKALQLGRIKQLAPYFESLFHAELARQVTELGYKLERKGHRWEIAGVSQNLIRRFSRRTEEIEKAAKNLGVTRAESKAALGARTRLKKDHRYTYEQLRNLWKDRVTQGELEEMGRACRQTGAALAPMSPGEALNYAAGHLFERNSVIDERSLISTALEYGLGRLKLEEVRAAFARQDYLRHTDAEGDVWVTTPALLAEERAVIGWAREGIGSCLPLGNPNRELNKEGTRLTPAQEKAARQLLASGDRVTVLSGVAGSGKTTMFREVVTAIEETGVKVMPLAPSADASRGVLRQSGFKKADTVAMFLSSAKLQEHVRGGVLWVDEASLLGTQDFKKLFAVAEKLNARVILSGDERQHSSPARGDGLRILREYAGIEPVGLREILRQQGQYREAVKELSQGKAVRGFDRLDRLGCVHEHEDLDRFDALGRKYAECVTQGKSVLAVAPTHAEAANATVSTRQWLKVAGHLNGEDREIGFNRNLQWTQAEKLDVTKYEPGQKLFFHKPAGGMRCGTWWQVTACDGQQVMLRDGRGIERPFRPTKAERYSVYQPETVSFAAGDVIRFTQNVTVPGGSGGSKGKKINSGSMYRLEKFSPLDGALVLKNLDGRGRSFRVPAKTGVITHGYVVTSHASQGKTVDTVLICQGTSAMKAASLQQAYVSASRGKTEIHWYTDDKEHLREAIARSAQRTSASELAEKAALQRLWDWQIRLRRDAIAYQVDIARTRGVTRSTLQNIGEKGLNQLPYRSPLNTKQQGRSHER